MTRKELSQLADEALIDLLTENAKALSACSEDFRAECNVTMIENEISSRKAPVTLTTYRAEPCSTPVRNWGLGGDR